MSMTSLLCAWTRIYPQISLLRKEYVRVGPMAVADDKTEWGIRLDILGYVIDLASRKLSIARKNFMNTIYGFMKVDLSLPMSLHAAQRLASWGSRYSMICRVMRPFCGALHRLSHGRKERQATFHLSEEAKIAIRGWRAMLCLVHLHKKSRLLSG